MKPSPSTAYASAGAAVLLACTLSPAGSASAQQPTPATSASNSASPTPTPTPVRDDVCVFYGHARPAWSGEGIVAGQGAELRIPQPTPNERIQVHAATAPSTEYRLVRDVIVDSASGDGQPDLVFTLRPPTNTTLTVTRSACEPARSGPIDLPVRPAITLDATRTDTRVYVFRGRHMPAKPGKTISLYRQQDGRGVLTAQTQVARDGSWTLPRRFAGSGTFDFNAMAAADQVNAAGSSRSRRTVIH